MIIKFGKIELADWVDDLQDFQLPSSIYFFNKIYREKNQPGVHRIYMHSDGQNTLGISILKYKYNIGYYVIFYRDLFFLNELFCSTLFLVDGDLALVKNYVDNFLIRMSNLKVFI